MADLKAKTEKKIAKSAHYDTSTGVLKRKTKFCAKCGPGVFMANHKDRYTCGKCGFTEKKNKA